METIIIKWMGMCEELERVEVEVEAANNDYNAVSDAIIKLVQGKVVYAGDRLIIEYSE